MKRILVPCDFSSTAQQAYNFALDIAKKANGEIHVLRVIDIPFMYEAYSTNVPAYLNPEQWQRLTDDATHAFQKMAGTYSRDTIKFHVIEGQVSATILDFIETENIDLVVMGTKGAAGLDELLIGSNTEKIVRFAKVPVLAVPRTVDVSSIKKIVVPTTLDLEQIDFIDKLKQLQSTLGAGLHLLVINTPHNLARSRYEQGDLENYAKHYQLKDVTLNIREDFSEESGILNFMEEIHGDMLAMATHGRRGLAHLFMGSVTEYVVNRSHYPIWTYSIRK